MKKNIKVIICIILVIIVAYLYAHIAKTHTIFSGDLDTSEFGNTATMETSVISQSFLSEEETLDGIRVKCIVVGNPDSIKLQYSLVDKESGQIVAEGIVKGKNIKSSKFHEFKFDQVTECKGKEYKFTITTLNETEENAIGVSYTPLGTKNTIFQVNDEVVDGTVILKTVTNRFDFETFAVFLVFIAYITVFMKFLFKLFK